MHTMVPKNMRADFSPKAAGQTCGVYAITVETPSVVGGPYRRDRSFSLKEAMTSEF